MGKTVVVTGVGPISALGVGYEPFRDSVLSGRSCGVDLADVKTEDGKYPIDLTGVEGRVAAPILNEERQALKEKIDDVLPEKKQNRIAELGTWAFASTILALQHAGITVEETEEMYEVPELPSKSTGVYMGTSSPGYGAIKEIREKFKDRGARGVSAFAIPQAMSNQPPSIVNLFLGLEGPSRAISTACASSNAAIRAALLEIRSGRVDAALAGGVDSILHPTLISGFDRIQATSRRNDEPEVASRPFDEERDGFIYGEGAGMVVIETEEHARKRGAEPLMELAGAGSNNDSHHITAPIPEGDGAARAMEAALYDSDMAVEDLDYINAHGTSTPMNDAMETRAIKLALGDHAYDVPVSSLKSQIGHSVAAAGILEVAATVIAFQEDKLPPTINHDIPGEDCDLDYVPREAREKRIDTALSNNFAFGGHNTTLAFRRYQ